MTAYLSKNSKWPQLPLRPLLIPFITLFSLLVCYTCMNQISLDKKTFRSSLLPVGPRQAKENVCSTTTIPSEEMGYIHFPQPKTFSRGECACTPVRYFVILSMQRSGSGWFETLLNSHPNISSNGEIFSVPHRRGNLSTIFNTLDTVYNLDWFSSAAKNECTAAYGLKWMLNQGVTKYHREILSYFKSKGVSVIFLFRRNLLRRMISVLANDYDRQAKQLNGTHKAHIHSKEEAEILAKFKPKLKPSSLIPNLQFMERTIAECLHNFRSVRHMVLYYEDIINNQKDKTWCQYSSNTSPLLIEIESPVSVWVEISCPMYHCYTWTENCCPHGSRRSDFLLTSQPAVNKVQEFLKVPVSELVSRHVKIHTRPLPQQVDNWSEVLEVLNGTEYAHFLNHADYNS